MTTAPIFHAGWRDRPDCLVGMGALANLLGMQYRIDHLENAKADATDIAIMPPLVIKGNVDDSQVRFMPGQNIHIEDADGSVEELGRNVQWVLQADNQIDRYVASIEEFAGAPKQASGFRTPGEKTKFEVQQLSTASGRMFQEKTTKLEVEFIEPALNSMLMLSRKQSDLVDVVRVFDEDVGGDEFLKVTAADITSKGKLRPVGARHFSTQANMIQDLANLSSTPMWADIKQNIQNYELTEMIMDTIIPQHYHIVKKNADLFAMADRGQLEDTVNMELETQAGMGLE